MATVNYFVGAKKRKLAPVYVRLSAGRNNDLIVKSGLMVNPSEWSAKTQTIKQRIKTDDEELFSEKLKNLRADIEAQIKTYGREFTKQWLEGVIYQFHNKKDAEAKTLNEYIEFYIKQIEAGKKQNKRGHNISLNTAKSLRGFQRIFNEYQGVYTEKRLKELKEKNKATRQRKNIDFEDVTIDMATAFQQFLIDEGYKVNTINKFLKLFRIFMSQSLKEKKHTNREFQEDAFPILEKEEAFSISLAPDEIEKLYKHDLRDNKRMEIARDKFIVLCETALRVSDYDKIDVNIITERGVRLIALSQTKTKKPVYIPLTKRMQAILKKYNGKLPKIHEVYVNKYIKYVALQVGLTEVHRWEETTYGKTFEKSEKRYNLISCHTGRRSGATNMYWAKIPIKTIMALTGHKTESQLIDYIKVTGKQLAVEASKNEYFSGSPLKIAK